MTNAIIETRKDKSGRFVAEFCPSKPQSTIETVYTIPEVCKILKLSRWTIGRWIEAGKIKAVNINPDKKGRRELRVKQSVLDKMLGGMTATDDQAPERKRRVQTDKAKRKRLLTTNNYL